MQATTASDYSNLIHNLVSGDLAIPVLLKTLRSSVQSFQYPCSAWLYLASLKPLGQAVKEYRGQVMIILVCLEIR